jgi:predicted transcriptional regulator
MKEGILKFFEKIYKKPVETSITEIGKGLKGTRDIFVKSPEQKEIAEIGGEFGLFFDKVIKNVLVETWTDLSGITAKQIMKKPKLVNQNTSIKTIANILKGNEEIVFVMDNKTLIGEIAEYDLVKQLVPANKMVKEIGLLGTFDKSYFGKTAKDVMRKQVTIVTPSTPIEKIAYLINNNDLIAIAVVKQRKIVGVIHTRDLMRFIK